MAGVFTWMFTKMLGKRRRVWVAAVSAVSITIYTLLVGASASVVRAAILGGLGLGARQVGRQQDGLNSLETNPREWIASLHPQIVLLCVQAGDSKGRPDLKVLDALVGVSLLRTDRNGWIHLSTDGKQMWVEVERK